MKWKKATAVFCAAAVMWTSAGGLHFGSAGTTVFDTAVTASAEQNNEVLLNEDFEKVTEEAIPNGWENLYLSENTDHKWSCGTGDYSSDTGAHSEKKNLLIKHDNTGDITMLVSPSEDLSGYKSAILDLWYINRSWGGDIDSFGVYYRIGDGKWEELFFTESNHESWTNLPLYLPDSALEKNVQIGFKAVDHYGYGVAIDDVVFTGSSSDERIDISNATVTLADDHSVESVKLGDVDIDLDECTVTYGKDDDHTLKTVPNLTGDYRAYVSVNATSNRYKGEAKSKEFSVVYVPEFTVTIPAKISLKGTGVVSVNYREGVICSDKVSVTIAGDADDENHLFSVRQGDDKLTYTIDGERWAGFGAPEDETTSVEVKDGETLLEVDGSTDTGAPREISLTFNEPPQSPKYAGEYKGIVTFNITVEEGNDFY